MAGKRRKKADGPVEHTEACREVMRQQAADVAAFALKFPKRCQTCEGSGFVDEDVRCEDCAARCPLCARPLRREYQFGIFVGYNLQVRRCGHTADIQPPVSIMTCLCSFDQSVEGDVSEADFEHAFSMVAEHERDLNAAMGEER